MKLDDIKQQMEYRDSLKWVQTKLKDIMNSNYTNIDLEIKFTKEYYNDGYCGPSKCGTHYILIGLNMSWFKNG